MLINPFDNNAFDLVSMTRSINLLPNNYGRVRELNVFPIVGVTSRTVLIESRNGVLNLLPTQPVGAPGTTATTPQRNMRSFYIPHIPHEGVILPSEYDGVRAFGSETALETLASIMNDRLVNLRNKHAITLEHLRMGALKGIVLDADGSEIYNWFEEFDITPKVVNFALTTETTDVRQKCLQVKRHIEDHLMGEVMSGVRCLCSETFFDGLTGHPDVHEAFKYQQGEKLQSDMRTGFVYAGITFEEYRGRAQDPDGNTRVFIEEGDAHFFPEGTMNTFETVCAPADFLETANTKGQELYAKQEPRKFNRGVDIHTQSNPLPICKRPGLLVKGTAS